MSASLRLVSRTLPACSSVGNIIIPGPGQVRFKHVKIGKPNRPEWFRNQLVELSKPAWEPLPPVDELWRDCDHSELMEERREWEEHINQLEKFYVEEMVDMFQRSKMVAIFHTNPIQRNKFRIAWQNGRRIGMELKRYNSRVGRAGLRGTQWENILHFWFSFPGDMNEQPLLFSPEVEPKKLLAFERKVPEFSLIACVVENRILSRREVADMVNMPSLDQTRAELVGLLGHHQQRTVQLLGSNQQQLATNLSQLVKDRSPPEES